MKTGLVVALAAGVALGAAIVLVFQDRLAPGAGQAGPDASAAARAGSESSGDVAAGSGGETGSQPAGTVTPPLEPVPLLGDDSTGLSAQADLDGLSPVDGTSSRPVPAVRLPPDLNPRDVYVDPATGMAVLRQLPDATGSGATAATSLPPGVYPRDVGVDPRTGATAVKSLPDGGS